MGPSLSPMAQADSPGPACRVFAKNWASSMPDAIVADQLTDDEGFLDPDCVENFRLERMVAEELIPEEILASEDENVESDQEDGE